jgi:hypothetical protein
MADDDLQPIFELEAKINGLMKWAKDTGRRDLTTLRALERKAQIPYSTLRDNMNLNKKNNDGRQQMSVAYQKKLAGAFGFPIDWREWRDPDATGQISPGTRIDTAKAFLAKFLVYKSRGARLTIDTGMTWKHIDRRFADFKLTVAGSFEPSSQADGVPLVVSVSFDPRGWPVFLDLTVGLKEVDLQLIHERAGAVIETFELTCRNEAEGNFRGRVEGVSRWWRINVTGDGGACLSGARLRNDGQDCICRGFQKDDEIKAVMSARVSDCFVSVDGTPLDDENEAKKRFKEHLLKLAALREAEAMLAEQILRVVERS